MDFHPRAKVNNNHNNSSAVYFGLPKKYSMRWRVGIVNKSAFIDKFVFRPIQMICTDLWAGSIYSDYLSYFLKIPDSFAVLDNEIWLFFRTTIIGIHNLHLFDLNNTYNTKKINFTLC